jgi:VIT1/CCC1 family predicted Fe2+/Mn2+ transporter
MTKYLDLIKDHLAEYIGFVALGLADAIVEVTGVHAGFLGVAGSTLIAGVAGLIVGFSAGISMGSAAYIQSKHDVNKSPIASGLTTGISYMICAVCLALPYFFIEAMLIAFIVSTCIGLILLGSFTYYGTRGSERKFLREFSESSILLLITAAASYVLGTVFGRIFHLTEQKF